MPDVPYTKTMDPKIKAIAIILVLLFIGLVVGVALAKVTLEYAAGEKAKGKTIDPRVKQYLTTLYTISMLIICMNLALLLGLLRIYIDAFRKTKSSFMFGLLLFISVLFIQSLLSLPFFPATLGESLSLIGLLPNMFETIALVILLYLSME